jgi:hypothetical protein
MLVTFQCTSVKHHLSTASGTVARETDHKSIDKSWKITIGQNLGCNGKIMKVRRIIRFYQAIIGGLKMSNAKLWVRNMYTGVGGGAYTGVGGGMYTGVGGGAYTGVGGGMYTGVGGGAYTGVGGGLYTGVGGGAYSGVGGGLYTGVGGGLYTGPGGGMYTGPDSNPYKAIHPPWPLFVVELRKMGKLAEAEVIARALRNIGWNI